MLILKQLVSREIERIHLYALYGSCCVMDQDIQYLCLLRTKNGPIELFNNFEQALIFMPSYFEILTAKGNWLSQLNSILAKIYLKPVSTIKIMSFIKTKKQFDAYRIDEFPLKYRKFLRVVSDASDLLNSNVELKVPQIDLDEDDRILLQNEKVTNAIDTTVIEWSYKMRDVTEQLKAYPTLNEGPLAEIEYWRDRATTLGRMVEQVSQPRAQRFLQLYALKEKISTDSIFEDLFLSHSEAIGNVK